MKQTIKRTIGLLLALAFLIAGIPFTEAQAAAKPVIQINGITVSGISGTMEIGEKIKLTAKSGKKNITKKCTWKSSRKNVAAVSKKGVLSAKKAGTTNITVKYKGKTSKKLKVVVLGQQKNPEETTKPEDPSEPGTDPEPPSEAGSYRITYNANGGTLSGPSAQNIKQSDGGKHSGEIMNFKTTARPASGKKFLGWFTKKEGGQRVYETYKPTGNMTLYAHYTDDNVQEVTFVLGCKYGDTYSFMSDASKSVAHYRDYDWLNHVDLSGPMVTGDAGNVTWKHTYAVNDKSAFTVDDLPVPSVPGYVFEGWYTKEQNRSVSTSTSADRIEENSDVSIGTTILYARFSKKLTISFDDLRGGKYDDIVIDSYKSISDCNQKLPVPEIPGATFLGWTMDADNRSMNWSKSIVTNDTTFLNCIEWYGFMCSGCGSVSKHRQDALVYDETGCDTAFGSMNDDYHVFEETDHFTLYPVYKYHRVDLSFDPNGGYFPYDVWNPNHYLTFDDGIDDPEYNHNGIGVYANGLGSQPYGLETFPGHESDPGVDIGCWQYGGGRKTLPVVRRRNYVFDKWVYFDEDGNEQEFTYSTILTKNMTVYAKWNPGTCTVRYDATDGEITKSESDRVGLNILSRYNVTTESTISKSGKQMPVPVSKEGREFLGWFTLDGDQVTSDTQILEDTTLFAHWGSLPKELPVTLKFNANGGTFKNSGDATKTIDPGDSFGQFPALEDYPDHDFSGWYIAKPDAAGTYDDSSFLQKATERTKAESKMMNSNNEITIVAKWGQTEHVTDIAMIDMDWKPVDKNNNSYEIIYGGKGNDAGIWFGATALPKTVRGPENNIKWTSSDPDIISITAGEEVIYSGNLFDSFTFGGKTGNVVLTARSEDNPNVSFDIHVTVKEK